MNNDYMNKWIQDWGIVTLFYGFEGKDKIMEGWVGSKWYLFFLETIYLPRGTLGGPVSC